MSQRADEGLPRLRQKTPDAHGETQTLSEMNIVTAAFSQNQNSALVLPVVSDCKRLIWIYSNQLSLQLDGAAELDKAFDKFPYLTQNQTAALAQRCSLHPDQVKMWFMVQRLRYGISWDCKDILKVRRKIMSSQGKKELHKYRGKNNNLKRGGKESVGKKAREVREKQRSNEGRMMGKNRRAIGQLEKKMKTEQTTKDRKVGEQEEDKINAQRKQKKMTVIDKMRKKKRADEATNTHRSSVKSSFEESTEMEPKQGGPPASSANPTDVCEVKEPVEVPNSSADCGTRMLPVTKTESQLAMMRKAFLHSPYLDNEEYNRLSMQSGVPRCMLVQWFSDTRYSIKKGRPHWMSQKQHKQVLAIITSRQFLMALTKQSEGCGKRATRKMTLDRSESRGEDEGVGDLQSRSDATSFENLTEENERGSSSKICKDAP
nr:homeobox and leucine zipper encoding b isoform X2 [Scatophagus argus]